VGGAHQGAPSPAPILPVEQNVRQTLLMIQRGYVLENGRIVLEGSGRELLNNEHVKTAYLGQ
jgi:branched-chain amino acid transport system ATP-binding protein